LAGSAIGLLIGCPFAPGGKVNSLKRSGDGAILCWRWRSWDKQPQNVPGQGQDRMAHKGSLVSDTQGLLLLSLGEVDSQSSGALSTPFLGTQVTLQRGTACPGVVDQVCEFSGDTVQSNPGSSLPMQLYADGVTCHFCQSSPLYCNK
jgi:hypothetical protein